MQFNVAVVLQMFLSLFLGASSLVGKIRVFNLLSLSLEMLVSNKTCVSMTNQCVLYSFAV